MSKNRDSYTRFARLYEPLLASPLNAVRHKVLAVCLRHGFTSVLEFACGSGSQGLLLQSAGIQWVGLDKSLAMLQSASKVKHGRVDMVAANALQAPFRQASFSASLASLFLHEQSLADTHAILSEMRRVSPYSILVEHRLPERNIDIPACMLAGFIERLLGKAVRTNFCAYMEAGGLEGLLAREGVQVLQRERVLGGAASLVVCKH